MMRTMLGAAAAAVVAAAACTIPSGEWPPPPPAAAPAPGTADTIFASVAAALLDEANRARRAAGLPMLRADAALNRAAMHYAGELAVRRVLDHHSPTAGLETMTRRIEAAGGSWRRAAENLARFTGTADEVAAEIIGLWLGSPSHRGNLLDRGFTHSGAGVARDRRGEWFIVQLYTLPPPGRD
jgi:uncharacterized protein YkwD